MFSTVGSSQDSNNTNYWSSNSSQGHSGVSIEPNINPLYNQSIQNPKAFFGKTITWNPPNSLNKSTVVKSDENGNNSNFKKPMPERKSDSVALTAGQLKTRPSLFQNKSPIRLGQKLPSQDKSNDNLLKRDQDNNTNNNISNETSHSEVAITPDEAKNTATTNNPEIKSEQNQPELINKKTEQSIQEAPQEKHKTEESDVGIKPQSDKSDQPQIHDSENDSNTSKNQLENTPKNNNDNDRVSSTDDPKVNNPEIKSEQTIEVPETNSAEKAKLTNSAESMSKLSIMKKYQEKANKIKCNAINKYAWFRHYYKNKAGENDGLLFENIHNIEENCNKEIQKLQQLKNNTATQETKQSLIYKINDRKAALQELEVQRYILCDLKYDLSKENYPKRNTETDEDYNKRQEQIQELKQAIEYTQQQIPKLEKKIKELNNSIQDTYAKLLPQLSTINLNQTDQKDNTKSEINAEINKTLQEQKVNTRKTVSRMSAKCQLNKTQNNLIDFSEEDTKKIDQLKTDVENDYKTKIASGNITNLINAHYQIEEVNLLKQIANTTDANKQQQLLTQYNNLPSIKTQTKLQELLDTNKTLDPKIAEHLQHKLDQGKRIEKYYIREPFTIKGRQIPGWMLNLYAKSTGKKYVDGKGIYTKAYLALEELKNTKSYRIDQSSTMADPAAELAQELLNLIDISDNVADKNQIALRSLVSICNTGDDQEQLKQFLKKIVPNKLKDTEPGQLSQLLFTDDQQSKLKTGQELFDVIWENLDSTQLQQLYYNFTNELLSYNYTANPTNEEGIFYENVLRSFYEAHDIATTIEEITETQNLPQGTTTEAAPANQTSPTGLDKTVKELIQDCLQCNSISTVIIQQSAIQIRAHIAEAKALVDNLDQNDNLDQKDIQQKYRDQVKDIMNKAYKILEETCNKFKDGTFSGIGIDVNDIADIGSCPILLRKFFNQQAREIDVQKLYPQEDYPELYNKFETKDKKPTKDELGRLHKLVCEQQSELGNIKAESGTKTISVGDQVCQCKYISEGSFGTVYKITLNQKEFVIKVPKDVSDASKLEEVKKEFEMAKYLQDSKNVSILLGQTEAKQAKYLSITYDMTENGSLIMPLINDVSWHKLSERIASSDVPLSKIKPQTMSTSQRMELCKQLFGSLDFMHKSGVMHRDIKPENIFIEIDDKGDPYVQIADYGTAKIAYNQLISPGIDFTHDFNTTHTKGLGTPLWMAPEILNKENYNSSADVFSMAQNFFEYVFPDDSVSWIMQDLLSYPKSAFKFPWKSANWRTAHDLSQYGETIQECWKFANQKQAHQALTTGPLAFIYNAKNEQELKEIFNNKEIPDDHQEKALKLFGALQDAKTSEKYTYAPKFNQDLPENLNKKPELLTDVDYTVQRYTENDPAFYRTPEYSDDILNLIAELGYGYKTEDMQNLAKQHSQMLCSDPSERANTGNVLTALTNIEAPKPAFKDKENDLNAKCNESIITETKRQYLALIDHKNPTSQSGLSPKEFFDNGHVYAIRTILSDNTDNKICDDQDLNKLEACRLSFLSTKAQILSDIEKLLNEKNIDKTRDALNQYEQDFIKTPKITNNKDDLFKDPGTGLAMLRFTRYKLEKTVDYNTNPITQLYIKELDDQIAKLEQKIQEKNPKQAQSSAENATTPSDINPNTTDSNNQQVANNTQSADPKTEDNPAHASYTEAQSSSSTITAENNTPLIPEKIHAQQAQQQQVQSSSDTNTKQINTALAQRQNAKLETIQNNIENGKISNQDILNAHSLSKIGTNKDIRKDASDILNSIKEKFPDDATQIDKLLNRKWQPKQRIGLNS